MNGITAKSKIDLNPDRKTLDSNAIPRKSFIRRFGVANKVPIKTLPRLLNPLKSTQLAANRVAPQNDVHSINETIQLTKGAAMNVTKPVINTTMTTDTAMDRSLTRSNTFVCDAVDDQQTKILSIKHNIPAANDTMNQTNVLLNKERTFKRSLSPIPGDSMNSAKRKLVHMSIDNKVAPALMPLNSTPRRSISYSDARKANLTFFGAKSVDFDEPLLDQPQTFTFDNITFDQSNNFAPDAAKLGSAPSASMHGNRVFDLTQTVAQNDTFYPENRNATQTLDSNAAEREPKNIDVAKAANDGDGNLTKTITGKFSSLFYRPAVASSCYAIVKKK